MNKYLIKREIPNASSIPSDKLDSTGKHSEGILIDMRNEGKTSNKNIVILPGIACTVFIMLNLLTC